MYIPLSDDKHRFVQDSSKSAHWKSETIFFSDNFCSNNVFFSTKNIFLGFCLGLHIAVVFHMQSLK